MERVSFKVAKAIKEAGYPQEGCGEYLNKYGAIDAYLGHNIARPYIMETWLWLWREKKVEIEILNDGVGLTSQIRVQGRPQFFSNDPEEVIIAAIEHLVDNGLIK